MIKQHSHLRIERLPISALHVTECQPRYADRLLHYIDLMQRYPDDAPGLISVQPSKYYPGLYELLDGHHRYCAHILCGRSTVLCLVIEEPETA